MCFSPHFYSITPACTSPTSKHPHSLTPNKINCVKLVAESFPPSLPPYHLETTHLGDLGPLSQVRWICLTVASRPGSRRLSRIPNYPSLTTATLGLDGLNYNIMRIYRTIPFFDLPLVILNAFHET